MMELHSLLSATGAAGGAYNGYWWIMLAAIVFAIMLPLAYLLGRNGGRPLHR